jgi:hypothetical protein
MRAALRLAAAGGLAALAACASPSEQATQAYADLTRLAEAVGAMRRERAPEDAPYSNADLARNFERIVFFSEFTLKDGRLAAEERESPLLKWERPVRWRLAGDAVAPQDGRLMEALGRRLAAVTGLDIAPAAPAEPNNLLVLVLGREARREAAEFLETLGGRGGLGLIQRLRDDDWSIPCAATLGAEPGRGVTQGVILVKAETAGLLRESCFHEEFAQVLGPGNDYGGARPSVFNDDGEFALLTEHDELILRALYDPRLESGMTRAEAMPLVRRILDELRPEKFGDGALASPAAPL